MQKKKESKLKNVRLGRAEDLSKEIRMQYNLPDTGLIVIESWMEPDINPKSIPIPELEKIIAELEELAYTGKEQIGGRKGYFISHCFYADAIDDLKNILKRGYLE